MGHIKIGNISVPIIYHQDVSGSVVTQPSFVLPVSPAEAASASAFSGSGYNVMRHGGRDFATIMAGGRTGLHDDSEIVVSAPVRNSGTYTCTVNVVRSQGGSTVALINQQTLTVSTLPPDSNSKYQRECGLVAVSYAFPDETQPEYQVKGYYIYKTEHDVITNTSYHTSDSFNLGYYLNIPLPAINKNNGLSLYYDDEYNEPPFDPSEPEEYDKEHDDTSDTITLPTDPTVGVTSAGFINVYNPSIGALQGLGDFIFPDPIPDVTQVTDVLIALIKICQTLANSNLINYVIDCHIIPWTPHTSGNANIKVGFRDTGINVPKVDSDYVTVACGSITLAEYFHGFQDYMLTRSRLYLPFLGFVDCKPEWWQGGTLTVDYKFNVIDGSFMAYVRSTSSKSNLSSSIIAQYAGNACMHLPLTGVNYSQMVSGVISAAMSPTSAAKGASPALGVAYSALNTIMAGGEVQQSNGYNSTAAMLGVRTPYLMIERPSPSYPSNYSHDKGMPTNISTTLSSITGYTVIEDIDLSGIPFTSDELSELRQLLADGVYF